MSHSERAPSGNNLTSVVFPFGMNLLNSLPTLGNPTSANQPETDNVVWQSNTRRTYDEKTCSSNWTINNNTARRRSWNYPTTSGTPSGTNLDEVDGKRLQSGTPDRMSHSERETSGNNTTSAGSPFGTNLSNGSPMGNPPSKKLKVGRGGVRTPPPELLPIIASNYRAQNQDE